MERRGFFEKYRQTNLATDPLPVKVLNNSIWKAEVLGQALDWANQYLQQKSCPSYLISPLLGKVVKELATADLTDCVSTSPTKRYPSKDEDEIDSECVENQRYQPLKLMQAVTAKVDEICLRYKEDHDQIEVDFPVTSLADSTVPVVHEVSAWSIKNSRRTQEDRMVVLPSIDRVFQLKTPMSYFAVFDGHSGVDAAAYSCAHLHRHLVTSPDFPGDLQSALTYAFEVTDTSLLMKCREENLRSGTTAVVTLLVPGNLYVAWAGDSQAVLIRNGKAKNLVNPHKPDREDEMQRIRSVGGEVICLGGTWRVNGNLAVSRAIGDPDYKDCVTSSPEFNHVVLDGSEDFLILACDGLWDVIEPETCVEILKKSLLAEDPSEFEFVSKDFCAAAKRKGSGDNITVVIVSLKSREDLRKAYSSEKMNGNVELAAEPIAMDITPPMVVEIAPPAPEPLVSPSTDKQKSSTQPPSATKSSSATKTSGKSPTKSTMAAKPTSNGLSGKAPVTATSKGTLGPRAPATARLAPTSRTALKVMEKKPATAATTKPPTSVASRAGVTAKTMAAKDAGGGGTKPATSKPASAVTSRATLATAKKPTKPDETDKSTASKTATGPRPRPGTVPSSARLGLTKSKIENGKAATDAPMKSAPLKDNAAAKKPVPTTLRQTASRESNTAALTRTAAKPTTASPPKPRVPSATASTRTTSSSSPPKPASAPLAKKSTASATAPKPTSPLKKPVAATAPKKEVRQNGHGPVATAKPIDKKIIPSRVKAVDSAAQKTATKLAVENLVEQVASPAAAGTDEVQGAELQLRATDVEIAQDAKNEVPSDPNVTEMKAPEPNIESVLITSTVNESFATTPEPQLPLDTGNVNEHNLQLASNLTDIVDIPATDYTGADENGGKVSDADVVSQVVDLVQKNLVLSDHPEAEVNSSPNMPVQMESLEIETNGFKSPVLEMAESDNVPVEEKILKTATEESPISFDNALIDSATAKESFDAGHHEPISHERKSLPGEYSDEGVENLREDCDNDIMHQGSPGIMNIVRRLDDEKQVHDFLAEKPVMEEIMTDGMEGQNLGERNEDTITHDLQEEKEYETEINRQEQTDYLSKKATECVENENFLPVISSSPTAVHNNPQYSDEVVYDREPINTTTLEELNHFDCKETHAVEKDEERDIVCFSKDEENVFTPTLDFQQPGHALDDVEHSETKDLKNVGYTSEQPNFSVEEIGHSKPEFQKHEDAHMDFAAEDSNQVLITSEEYNGFQLNDNKLTLHIDEELQIETNQNGMEEHNMKEMEEGDRLGLSNDVLHAGEDAIMKIPEDIISTNQLIAPSEETYEALNEYRSSPVDLVTAVPPTLDEDFQAVKEYPSSSVDIMPGVAPTLEEDFQALSSYGLSTEKLADYHETDGNQNNEFVNEVVNHEDSSHHHVTNPFAVPDYNQDHCDTYAEDDGSEERQLVETVVGETADKTELKQSDFEFSQDERSQKLASPDFQMNLDGTEEMKDPDVQINSEIPSSLGNPFGLNNPFDRDTSDHDEYLVSSKNDMQNLKFDSNTCFGGYQNVPDSFTIPENHFREYDYPAEIAPTFSTFGHAGISKVADIIPNNGKYGESEAALFGDEDGQFKYDSNKMETKDNNFSVSNGNQPLGTEHTLLNFSESHLQTNYQGTMSDVHVDTESSHTANNTSDARNTSDNLIDNIGQ